MANQDNSTALDSAAVNALVCHWVRRLAATESVADPDLVASAFILPLRDAIDRAERARISHEMSFGTGIELGVAAAIAVIGSPFSDPTKLLQEAIDRAEADLLDSAADEEKYANA